MTKNKGEFKGFLNAARLDVLPERESRITALRYGLLETPPHTLAEIGKELGLTREGVRQILIRAHDRIAKVAESEIKAGETDLPSVRLALYISDSIGPNSDKFVERLSDFIIGEFDDVVVTAQVVEFVSQLAAVGLEIAKPEHNSVWELIKERHSAVNIHSTVQARFEGLLRYVVWSDKTKIFTM